MSQPKPKPYTITAVREARWLLTLQPGEYFVKGCMNAAREAELVRMGALIESDRPDCWAVVHLDNIDELPVRQYKRRHR